VLAAAAALAGCGSSAAPQSSRVSAITHSGLRFTYVLSVSGGQACATESYAGLREKGQPPTASSHFCGPAGQRTPPTLIQVSHPKSAFILDRPVSCTTVRVGRETGRLSAADTQCSASGSRLRLTVLPLGRQVRVSGITGVSVVALSRDPCSFICTRQLVVAP